jgi:hypothetical protein
MDSESPASPPHPFSTDVSAGDGMHDARKENEFVCAPLELMDA